MEKKAVFFGGVGIGFWDLVLGFMDNDGDLNTKEHGK